MYIPETDNERQKLLLKTGIKNTDELFSIIPEKARLKKPLSLPPAMSEFELSEHLKQLAGKNSPAQELICFLGGGVYDHYAPAAIGELLSRQEFYTAYTPYQPEISQGTLMGLFEFQSSICNLTGMDVSNASMYDFATSAAEAALMADAVKKRRHIAVTGASHPEMLQTLKTYARGAGIEITVLPFSKDGGSLDAACNLEHKKYSAVIAQNPNFFGIIEDMTQITKLTHEADALSIALCDPLSLALLKTPGEYGADIAVGEIGLGLPMSFGGPFAGYFACKNEYLRRMPGRIVGMTTDKNGNRAFTLTMQAREQHIRRQRATSNICSNQSLCAMASNIYLSLMGKKGLELAASHSVYGARFLYDALIKTGKFEPVFTRPFFKEFLIRPKTKDIKLFLSKMRESGILAGIDMGALYPTLAGTIQVAVTEKRTENELTAYIQAAEAVL